MTKLLANAIVSQHYSVGDPLVPPAWQRSRDGDQEYPCMTQSAFLNQLQQTQGIDKLLQVVARLRHPEEGCPWDLKQTHQSLKPYMLEESYEALEAIDVFDETGEVHSLREELGDVLLQVALHSQIAQDAGHFNFQDVCEEIADKLIRRHPHVFASVEANDADTVVANWEAIKRAEKAQASGTAVSQTPESILKGVSKSQPALSRALETSKRAVKVGFAWPSLDSLWACVMSEYDEFQAEIKPLSPDGAVTPEQFARLESEMGDILFANVNLARHFKIDPEVSLSKATTKFTRRFQMMETLLLQEIQTQSPQVETASLNLSERMSHLDFETWDTLWNRAKAACDKPEVL
jgi:MazG family protein